VNHKIILAGVLAALLPAAALAQPADPNCVASNNNSRIEGTVLGAGAGAILGSVLAGRHSHGEGAVLGAVGGGVAGNVIAGSRNDPCPPGYYYGPNGPPAPPPGPGYNNGYNNGYAPPPPNGYYGANYTPPSDPGYGHFWAGAPQDISQRIDFMRTRIQNGQNSGNLQPYQVHRAYSELHSIHSWMTTRYNHNGGYLTPDDRGYIQARLDHLGASIHWMERTGY
jgi:hypothetical protein